MPPDRCLQLPVPMTEGCPGYGNVHHLQYGHMGTSTSLEQPLRPQFLCQDSGTNCAMAPLCYGGLLSGGGSKPEPAASCTWQRTAVGRRQPLRTAAVALREATAAASAAWTDFLRAVQPSDAPSNGMHSVRQGTQLVAASQQHILPAPQV